MATTAPLRGRHDRWSKKREINHTRSRVLIYSGFFFSELARRSINEWKKYFSYVVVSFRGSIWVYIYIRIKKKRKYRKNKNRLDSHLYRRPIDSNSSCSPNWNLLSNNRETNIITVLHEKRMIRMCGGKKKSKYVPFFSESNKLLVLWYWDSSAHNSPNTASKSTSWVSK